MRKSMHQIVCLPDTRMRHSDRWRRHCNRRGGQKSQCLAIHGETPIPARYDRYRIRYQGAFSSLANEWAMNDMSTPASAVS
jgi:hypothetical protein